MSITDNLTYDLGKICESGDIGLLVTYYPSSGTNVETYVILRKERGVNEDGSVISSYLTAIIQKQHVDPVSQGDKFEDVSELKEYKVIEIIAHDDAHSTAIVEVIS